MRSQVWASMRHDKYYRLHCQSWPGARRLVSRILKLHRLSRGPRRIPRLSSATDAFSGQKLVKASLIKRKTARLLRLEQGPAVPLYRFPSISAVTVHGDPPVPQRMMHKSLTDY
ncbi:unnamed protein product [Rangifer tarandus platyrhynchus]|uniref:Uncharacterized protein n=2 Tax=Rangifer tarandus platyrhynchus TaxID=3082113 RepID=A0ABN8Y2W6_RANTA|nr:unnamed protein product [Rangifer tarandus platyrhynchus]CAI9693191.1 unnamed protein product [Rangifer tarandus platyrhynchus]